MKQYKYKVYLDVESTGLKGKLNLIQYSINQDERIYIFRPFLHEEHANLFLKILQCEDTLVIGYNIGFDLFKLYQHYGVEEPFKCDCLDLYTHTLRGNPLNKYPLKGKSIIKVTKVPELVVDILEKKIIEKLREMIPDYLEIRCSHHNQDKERKDLITLSFKINFSLKLKDLIAKLFPEEKTLHYEDLWNLVEKEDTHIPFVCPDELEKYEFSFNKNERELDKENSPCYKYAANDIKYLRMLEKWLIEQGNETFQIEGQKTLLLDENDFATHIVAYTKFFGFSVNTEAILEKEKALEKELNEIQKICDDLDFNAGSFKQKKDLYLQYKTEEALIPASFDADHIKIILENGWITGEGKEIFEKILRWNAINQRYKQIEILAKSARNFDRVFPDFRVFGTTTNRMAGSGGINFQGISREQGIRELIYCSQGGDFDSLEIGIAASYFQDKQMLADLDNNVDLHTQTACLLKIFNASYDNAMILKNLKIIEHQTFSSNKFVVYYDEKELDISEKQKKQLKELQIEFKNARSKAKQINFAILYFATSMKIAQILKLEFEEAEQLMKDTFFSHYPQLLKNREKFQRDIVTVDTEKWTISCIDNMVETVTDAVGNVRNFSTEKQVCKYFWENAKSIAKEACKMSEEKNKKYSLQENFLEEKKEFISCKKIIRQKQKGEQTIENAIYSSILGAVISIQNALYRQAGNYPIQSTGATFTKKLMQEIWEKHRCAMMNVHDEIIIPSEYSEKYLEIKKTVSHFIEKNKKITKHLSMEWKEISNWSEK